MKFEVRGLFASFRYAWQGFAHCVRAERNFRIHLVAAFYALTLGLLLRLSGSDFAVLLLAICGVLFAEMINTAIETLVDLASPAHHPLAKRAKDVAAGAVLVCAVVSVGVGFSLLWQPDKLAALLLAPPWAGLFAGSLLPALLFIFAVRAQNTPKGQ